VTRRDIDIARRRLAHQQLLTPTLTDAAEVVRRLGAVDAVVEQGLSDGSILRTHVLRPTWHVVTPADIRWMLALTAPWVKAAMTMTGSWSARRRTRVRRLSRAAG